MMFLTDKRWTGQKVSKLFVHMSSEESGTLWTFDIQCDTCQKVVERKGSKTKLFEVLSRLRKGPNTEWHWSRDHRMERCDSCCEEVAKQKEEELRYRRVETERLDDKKSQDNTLFFIQNYLNPKNAWTVPQSQWFRELLISLHGTRSEEVALAIRSLAYHDFLATPYWKAVARQIRYLAGFSCSLCPEKNKPLVVHHRTYERHGYEHLNLSDLICLCDPCHARFHDKLPKSKTGQESLAVAGIPDYL